MYRVDIAALKPIWVFGCTIEVFCLWWWLADSDKYDTSLTSKRISKDHVSLMITIISQQNILRYSLARVFYAAVIV